MKENLMGKTKSEEGIKKVTANLDPLAKMTHGIHHFKKSGQMPAGKEHLQEAIDGYMDGLIEDKGGIESISTAQLGLINNERITKGVILLIAEKLSEAGMFTDKGEVKPYLKCFATYLNTSRLNLMALGLERRKPEPLETIDTVIKDLKR